MSIIKVTEENFVSCLKKKNQKALEYIIDNYGWIVKSIVAKDLYNLVDYQEECINDVFLGAWENILSFDEDKGTFKNWLAGITKYKTIDYRRKYLKYLQKENTDDLTIISEEGAYEELTKYELDEDLDKLLCCLKSEDKDLFMRLYVKDQEIKDVIKETGLKRSVIYNRISRGKRKLRKRFHILERRM